MSDKMKKKTTIVLTKADYLSYHPPSPLPSFPPGVHVVCMLRHQSHHWIHNGKQESRGKYRLVNTTACHSHLSEPSGFWPHLSTPVMMWPPVRFQLWGLIAFQPHIIFSKYITFAGPRIFSIHINTLSKWIWHVSSQALLRIHVYHKIFSLYLICIRKNYCHGSASRRVKYISPQWCNAYL